MIEVKGGTSVNIADVLALSDVLRRDTALLAGLIVMDVIARQGEELRSADGWRLGRARRQVPAEADVDGRQPAGGVRQCHILRSTS